MQRPPSVVEVRIPAKGILRLRDSGGCRVQVIAGAVWITEEGDPCDPVLTESASHRIARNGLTILQAFTETRLRISSPEHAGRRLEVGIARMYQFRWRNLLRQIGLKGAAALGLRMAPPQRLDW